jgi:uncharacterized protein (TIGR03067 family)
MPRLLLVLPALLCLGFAPAPFLVKPQKQTDLGRFQGTWYGPGNLELRIKGTDYVYYRNGKPTIPYTITLNEAASPPQYQLTGVGTAKGRNYHGIYKFEAGNLVLCSSHVGSPRPTNFARPAGGEYKVMKRTKP